MTVLKLAVGGIDRHLPLSTRYASTKPWRF